MFGESLKNIRLSKGLSQKELANILTVSFQTISHWESNYSEPDLTTLKRLTEVLNCSYEDLMDCV